MARCPTCQTPFERGEQYCPLDGSPLALEPVPGDALVGRVLGGRYRLTSRIGQGGMGTVYRGMHTLMDKPTAVKILRGELATDTEAVARFHREARSASRLDHDHCIRVSDFGQTDDGLLYLAMELLEGRSLGARLRESKPSIGESIAVAHAVALALDHAHEAGVIHRDLKPDNVFLARRPRGREIVKVLDFGLAKLASDSGKSHSITRDGTVFGTPEYMAPEQAQGDPLDVRTDLYSLGVLLYRMTTGELPFTGETFVQVLTKQVRNEPRPPREIDPTIPPAIEAIILRCLAKRPADRYPSAAALADALAPYIARGDSTGPTQQSRSYDQPSPSNGADAATTIPDPEPHDSSMLEVPSHRTPQIAAVGLLVLVIGAAVIGAMRSHETPPPRIAQPAADHSLEDIARLAQDNHLDEAAAQLELLHRHGESAPLERLTADVAEKRGHRLDALAHLHRAKTLAPEDASIRSALADLLLRLGDKPDACTQARRAELLATTAGDAATLSATRGILGRASCPPTP